MDDTNASEANFLGGAVERWRDELKEFDTRRELLMQKLAAAERLLQLLTDGVPLPTGRTQRQSGTA